MSRDVDYSKNIGHEPIVSMAIEPTPALNRISEKRLNQAVYRSTEIMLHNVHNSESGKLSVWTLM